MLIRDLRKRAVVFFTVPILGTSWSLSAAEHDHPVPEKLGTVRFPTSCSSKEQKNFERAVALLHSFAYSAAEKAFSDVIKADPNCAMAHWGVAMTYVHPLWEPYLAPKDVARGKAEIERAKQLGGSELERGFIEALSMIYAEAESAPYRKRADAYAVAMGKLAERNPDNVECQVFYALALIGTASPSDSTHANEKKTVGLLEPLFRKYPQHPGIPHYLIHACDNAEMASRGVESARVYSQIAPSAPHALHMPSHIYTRLGMWRESIASNEAARKAAREQGDRGEELHAMDYLTYAFLQLGDDAKAERVLNDLRSMPDLDGSEFKIGYAASAMPARYAIERRQWSDAAQLIPMDRAQPQVQAVTLWARSVGLARSGKPAEAKQEVEKLRSAYEQLRASGEDYWMTQVHVQINEALAWVALAEKKFDDAVKLMRAAADEEDAVEKRPVTPGAIVPAREQLGDLLVEAGDAKNAVKEFNSAFAQAPRRRGTLMGMAKVAEPGPKEND
jgi:tetratricopeptide (TPR) repeat protein